MRPKRLEDIVGSIFGDFGYRPQVTAYCADGGIDVYLDSDQGLVGIQVKRSKNPIEIKQVNSLTGALLVNDCASGVFVTTSPFRRSCEAGSGQSTRARASGRVI
ncbi:restriction endonuclease [Mesorhizobium australicum]|uniref:restriction endonuclease n=1 Tax=Mesorhizobium australicum TaxID=536018 RepID=UPI0033386972